MKHLLCLALLVATAGCGSGSAGSTPHDGGHNGSGDASGEKDASSDAKTKSHGDASGEGGSAEEGGAGEGGSEDAGEGGAEAGGDGGDAASSGSSAWCAQTVMGVPYCYGQEGLAPAQVTTFDSTCMTNTGTVVSSCGATGLVGCCTYAAATTLVYCSYSGTASADQTSCTTMGGTWSTSP